VKRHDGLRVGRGEYRGEQRGDDGEVQESHPMPFDALRRDHWKHAVREVNGPSGGRPIAMGQANCFCA
jgi:hypothetical protein